MEDGRDARSLTGSAQAAVRERAVRMLLRGATHVAVAEAMGVHARTVAKWSARFELFGWEGLGERAAVGVRVSRWRSQRLSRPS